MCVLNGGGLRTRNSDFDLPALKNYMDVETWGGFDSQLTADFQHD